MHRAPVELGDLENVPFATFRFRVVMITHVLEKSEAELDDSLAHESAAHVVGLCTQNCSPVDVRRVSQVDLPDDRFMVQALIAQLSLLFAC